MSSLPVNDEGPIIFYDLPSRDRTCWSPNTWKTRFVLNHKKLDYKTEWIEGPDIAPTFKAFGFTPNKAGTAANDYTVPTITLPFGTHIMESWRIATALEAWYPPPKYPSLHLDSPVRAHVQDAWFKVVRPLAAVLVPAQNRNVFGGVNVKWHQEIRKKTYGMSLWDYEKQSGGEGAWEKAAPGLKEWAAILRETEAEGPFCLGATPSYADFLIVGFLEWCKCCGEGIFERVMAADEGFGKLYDACKPWLERNDH